MRTEVFTDPKMIEKVIKNCHVCHVAIADKEGNPYVFPMNFGYSKNTIILHSALTGTHLDILKENNRACISFCSDSNLAWENPKVACSYHMKAQSVICHGTIDFIEDYQEKINAMNLFMKNYSNQDFSYSKPAINHVRIWKFSIEKQTCKTFGRTTNQLKQQP